MRISGFPSSLISCTIGVERISLVCPRLTCQAIFASSPESMLKILSEPSFHTMTANNWPCPQRSSAALGAVILWEKSAIIEPYASAPSSRPIQLTTGLSMTPYTVTSSTLPSPGPPSGPCEGIVPLWVGVRAYWPHGCVSPSHVWFSLEE